MTGGCLNASGRLVVRVTRVGADTQLAQMTRLVTEAQKTPPLSRWRRWGSSTR